MAKNKVNDNGLKNNVPKAIRDWYRCKYEIKKLEKEQEQCSKDIKHELDSARESGYTEKEIKELIGREKIKELIGSIVIPSWYLRGNNIDR